MIIDPFISAHSINENDNGEVDAVVKEFGRLASKARVAVDLVHHTRKPNKDKLAVDTIRGASSFANGVRSARTLAQMTQDEYDDFGLKQIDEQGNKRPGPRSYFAVYDAKPNFAPPSDERKWFFLQSTPVGNGCVIDGDDHPGDFVGVPVPWNAEEHQSDFESQWKARLPEILQLFKTEQRASELAKDRVGYRVAKVLGMEAGEGKQKGKCTTEQRSTRARIGTILAKCEGAGWITIEQGVSANYRNNSSLPTD